MAPDEQPTHHSRSPYLMLALNLLVSGIIMYFAMFAMIDQLADFFHNLNMAYMALMMVAPMGVLMVLMMPSMYRNRAANAAILAGFLAVFLLSFLAIRQQAAIGDEQFLRSMIPHHSGAILMCREAQLADPQVKALCQRIVRSQRAEIDEMNGILARR